MPALLFTHIPLAARDPRHQPRNKAADRNGFGRFVHIHAAVQ